jgi:alkane 1-monooxygenase
VQFALLVWALHAIGTEQATLLEAIGLALAVGTCTGAVGITLAHELIHRRHRAERLLGEALLVSVTYHHFTVEHVDGHHRRVATPHDPVSAPLGRSVYRALPRAIGGSFVSAWRLEGARLARRGRPFWSLRNRVLAGVLAEIALYGAIGAVFGGWAALFMAGQSLYAVIELEFVNYIEHYGLERRETAPGVYEPVAARHSWDSDRRLNAWLLFNLPRHADHHLHPGRRYEELVLLGAAPRLPSGYAGSTLLALVPPLWFRMVDPRARAANAA